MKNDNRQIPEGNRIRTAILFLTILCLVWLNPTATFAVAQSNLLDAQLITLAGEAIDGQLVAVSADLVVLRVGENEKTFSLESISKLDFGNIVEPIIDELTTDESAGVTTAVELVDGSALVCEKISLDKRELSLDLRCGAKSQVDARNVLPILTQPLDAAITKAMWDEVVSEAEIVSDGLVVSRKGKLQSIEGVIGGLSDELVTFTVDEQTRDVKLSRLQGVYFYRPSTKEFSPPICQLRFIDGSTVNTRAINVENETIEVTSVCGAVFVTKSTEIASLDFAVGRDVYLSDLEPTTNEWSPLIASPLIVEKLKSFRLARRNESRSGQPLRIQIAENGVASLTQIKEFGNGLSISGGGRLAFSLNGQFEKLTGLIGFDPESNQSGVVKFVIQVDGETRMESQLAHRDLSEPVSVDVDVSGGKRLVIKVEYGDGLSVGDQVHFVDAVLSR